MQLEKVLADTDEIDAENEQFKKQLYEKDTVITQLKDVAKGKYPC